MKIILAILAIQKALRLLAFHRHCWVSHMDFIQLALEDGMNPLSMQYAQNGAETNEKI